MGFALFQSAVGTRLEDTADTLRIISHASHMLQHIINEVIDLTKLESGATQVVFLIELFMCARYVLVWGCPICACLCARVRA